ncbi:MAG TPA: GIY-YIG nuclease family protein [Thermodesulfobacteriota bacterium]|nr:GIY-YIG nuclease family protein [Thermodesulfobacteriota bacterium]
MPIMFNTILREAGLPLNDIRLIRHKDKRAKRGFTPYELWRDNRPQFENYQSTQSISNRPKLNAPYWAVFIVNLSDETMFAGLYAVNYRGLLEKDTPMPHMDGIDKAGSCDVYDLKLQDKLQDLIGKVFIDWGPGALAWVQYAARNDKPITELRREFREPDFPGFLNFIQPLSKLDDLPKSWVATLKSSRGVYLLTCPKTKEQYVGSARGEEGFWGRWQNYVSTGHGGNEGLKSRDPSDYQVSILEVAGSSATPDDILVMETRWKSKLQSREMGLNRN